MKPMSIDFEDYLKHVHFEKLLTMLGVADSEVLAKTVMHFTAKEGERRDKIVQGYFGRCGIELIVDAITESLTTRPKPAVSAEVLDVGAGSGFFTMKVAEKLRFSLPGTKFFAMDLTPAMLSSLAKKKAAITPFIGVAENIEGSIEQARKYLKIPERFDAVFSTLMLHHSAQPESVFESISRVLRKGGKTVVVDLCQHGFKEFKTEMGDVHLGFKLRDIRKMARKYFSKVEVKKLPGICCKSSGRSAEIFVAEMQNASENKTK